MIFSAIPQEKVGGTVHNGFRYSETSQYFLTIWQKDGFQVAESGSPKVIHLLHRREIGTNEYIRSEAIIIALFTCPQMQLYAE